MNFGLASGRIISAVCRVAMLVREETLIKGDTYFNEDTQGNGAY